MTRTPLEDLVRNAAWPAPSPELRARVMSETHVAASPITWSDRVWFSRTWRMSAAAAALVLAGNILTLNSSVNVVRVPADLATSAPMLEELGLPPDLAASLAWRSKLEGQPRPQGPRDWSVVMDFSGANR